MSYVRQSLGWTSFSSFGKKVQTTLKKKSSHDVCKAAEVPAQYRQRCADKVMAGKTPTQAVAELEREVSAEISAPASSSPEPLKPGLNRLNTNTILIAAGIGVGVIYFMRRK